MKSFKSLIVFIISIFINIILISESAKSKVKLEQNNTFINGNFLCTSCGENDILIELYERGKPIRVYPGDCGKGSFYIILYSPSTYPYRFRGSFSQICNQTIKHKKNNLQAKYLTTIPPYNYYTFGTINLKN